MTFWDLEAKNRNKRESAQRTSAQAIFTIALRQSSQITQSQTVHFPLKQNLPKVLLTAEDHKRTMQQHKFKLKYKQM